MLCDYAPDCTDFSGNGLGTISPSSALVKETLNGEYELEVVHPLDDVGKWHRLVEGNIIRAPVPAGATPQVALSYKEYSEGKAIYRIDNTQVLQNAIWSAGSVGTTT